MTHLSVEIAHDQRIKFTAYGVNLWRLEGAVTIAQQH